MKLHKNWNSKFLPKPWVGVLLGGLVTTAAVAAAINYPAPNPTLLDTPWQHYHSTTAMQASTAMAGPSSSNPRVTISDFIDDAGVQMGPSPWHVIGPNHYSDSSTARAVWGSTMEYVYKYIVDGERFELIDTFETNSIPGAIAWNFHLLANGRLLVPSPIGLRTVSRRHKCYSRKPSILFFEETGNTTDSSFDCVEKFEISDWLIRRECGWGNAMFGRTGINQSVMHNGTIGIHLFRRSPQEMWMLIVDADTMDVKNCVRVGAGENTNGTPSEPITSTKDAIYFGLDEKMVKATYDSATNDFDVVWEVDAGFRSGRTGSTPTLMGLGNDPDKFVVAIDARCAVQNPIQGNIACDSGGGPSKLVAIRRDTGEVLKHNLPGWLDTVECSPTVLGYDLAVSDYSGYTPDWPLEGQADFAKGVVKVRWNPNTQNFITDWDRDDIQLNGVNTISEGSRMIYGNGAAEDGFAYTYGIDLDTGDIVFAKQIGPAPDVDGSGVGSIYDALTSGGYYDQGNNILIDDQGNLIWPAGNALVRLRD